MKVEYNKAIVGVLTSGKDKKQRNQEDKQKELFSRQKGKVNNTRKNTKAFDDVLKSTYLSDVTFSVRA